MYIDLSPLPRSVGTVIVLLGHALVRLAVHKHPSGSNRKVSLTGPWGLQRPHNEFSSHKGAGSDSRPALVVACWVPVALSTQNLLH